MYTFSAIYFIASLNWRTYKVHCDVSLVTTRHISSGALELIVMDREYRGLGLEPRALPRSSTASGLYVCECSREELYDNSVTLILNTDEILKLVKKKMN